jgi:hypothetical protein
MLVYLRTLSLLIPNQPSFTENTRSLGDPVRYAVAVLSQATSLEQPISFFNIGRRQGRQNFIHLINILQPAVQIPG